MGADYKLEPDGLLGRSLEVLADTTITYPLALSGEVSLSAVARLYPHDWRDLHGAVRVVVSVTTAGGERELWARVLRAGDRGRPGGIHLRVALPADTTALHLGVRGPRSPAAESPVARAVFVEPALRDPAGPGPAIRPTAAPLTEPAAEPEPLFSVLIPVHDPPPQMLREAVASVRAQTFDDWELCLVDDGSRDPEVLALLQEYAADFRICLHRHETACGISAATNAALERAGGRYVALLDHDDTLAPDALAEIASVIATDPGLDMVYSDEDVVSDGVVLEPHPKPGWSPEHMTALMYTCHLGVYRRALALDLGGFDPRYDGCQDFDFVLRLMERTDRIAHVPRMLYHWRAHPASTATFGGGAKPHAFLAQPAAIRSHLARTGIDADVRHGYLPGIHRIVHRIDPAASVAVALSVASADGLAAAVRSWLRQAHAAWRLVLAAPAERHTEVAAILHGAGLAPERYELLDRGHDHGAAALASAAERAAALADYVLLLQAPALGLTTDWMTRLIGYASQRGVAAAGPVLLGPTGSIVQAGVALPEGLPIHLFYDLPPVSAPPAVMNVRALSGALLTRSAGIAETGPPDPSFGELGLIEWCLEATASGQRAVLVPDARLRVCAGGAVINDLPALWALHDRWTAHGATDHYYNAGYLTDRGDLAMRPR